MIKANTKCKIIKQKKPLQTPGVFKNNIKNKLNKYYKIIIPKNTLQTPGVFNNIYKK